MGIGGRMNNYEKIKSMSVDEMAKWLYDFNDDSLCHYCYGCNEENEELGCEEYFEQWLLAEIED